MIGYIYLITNLKNGMQYVGQTRNTIQQRYSGHKSDAKNKSDNVYLHNAMNAYGFESFNVKEVARIEYDDFGDLIDELNYLEQYYIATYNTLFPNGYNLTKGGSEICEWHKLPVDEYDLYGNFISTHDSMVAAARLLGVSTSNAIRFCCNGEIKFAYQRIWRFHGESFDKYELPDIDAISRERRRIPVDQYTINGLLVDSYDSILQASICVGTDSNSHISECCNGKLYTAYGFVWRYKGESFDKYPTKEKRLVRCEKYDLDNNFIEKYDSIKDACLSIGKDPTKCSTKITRCCRGKSKTAYGYIWKYSII